MVDETCRPIQGTAGVRVGCDVQSISAVEAAIGRLGERYLARVLGPAERGCHRNPSAAWVAGRYAAKEAVLKLIGTPDGIALTSIEVLADPAGRPQVELSGTALARHDAAGLGVVDVSLSHDGDFAIAVAVAVVPTVPSTATASARASHVEPGSGGASSVADLLIRAMKEVA